MTRRHHPTAASPSSRAATPALDPIPRRDRVHRAGQPAAAVHPLQQAGLSLRRVSPRLHGPYWRVDRQGRRAASPDGSAPPRPPAHRMDRQRTAQLHRTVAEMRALAEKAREIILAAEQASGSAP